METIRGLPEAVEEKDDFAGSIIARDESLAMYAAQPGLGPPDLCWLQKAAKGAYFATAAEPRGFFHYCLGRDVSSSAAIAAYFAELNARADPISMMQGLWYTSEITIQRGFYCVYDPFSRLDVRCELCIPGGVVCGALDAEGTVHEVTPDMWRNCMVAAFLRHQLMDPNLTQHSTNLHRTQPLLNADAETRLLEAVLDMYRTRVLPPALTAVTADTERGCVAEHMDLVLYCIYQFFGARHRWPAALAFFTRLKEVYLNAAVYVAAVQRELDDFDGSWATLSNAVHSSPQEPCLLLALANECMYADSLDMAAKLTRRAVRLHHHLRPAWLLLARCYIRQGLYSLALITLNAVPPPPGVTQEEELLFGVPAADPKYLTKPSAVRYDPDEAAAKQMNVEEVASDGSRALMYLPATKMVPREPLDLGPWPDLGPARATRAALSAAYGLLQELVAAIGWDSFLEMRARVFIMQSETDKRPSGTQEGPRDAEFYNMALEELAAVGMSEFPDEIQAARADNARAEALRAEEQAMEAARAREAAEHAANQANVLLAATTIVESAEQLRAEAVAAEEQKRAQRAQARATAAAAEARAAALAATQGSDQVKPEATRAQAALAKDETDHGVATGNGNGVEGKRVSEKLPPDGLTAVASLPPAASGMTSLWSLMFGQPKSQAARSEVDQQQLVRLQQYGSATLPSNSTPTKSLPSPKPGPVAEATESLASPTQSLSDGMVGWTCRRGQLPGLRCSRPGVPVTLPAHQCSPRSAWLLALTAPGSQAHTSTVKPSGQDAPLAREHQGALQSSTHLPEPNLWQAAEGPALSHPLTTGEQHSGLGAAQARRLAHRLLQTLLRRPTSRSCSHPTWLNIEAASACSGNDHRPAAVSKGSIPACFQGASHAVPGPVCEAREQYAPGVYFTDGGDSDSGSEDGDEDGHWEHEDSYHRHRSPGAVQQPHVGGPVLSNQEADREFVLLGAAAAGEEEHQAKAKRLCVRWLDELIIALWHDLQAYMEWKAQDTELHKAVGNTLAGLVLGTPSDATGAQTAGSTGDMETASGVARRQSSPPQLPPGDWMRRGLLAERLYHDAEALQAYRCCLASGPFNLMAAHAVMRLAAEAADTRLALQACIKALGWHASQLGPAGLVAFAPTAATCCVGHVASLMPPPDLQQLIDELLGAEEGYNACEAVRSWLKAMVAAHRWQHTYQA